MQQAVAAEVEARQAIAAADAQALASIEQARAQARAIANDVPARTARLRRRHARAAEQALARIQGDEAAALQKLKAAAVPPDLLDATVARLVRALTGADDDHVAGAP